MCGIAGYVGKGDVVTALLEMLVELQHRGQEHAGIAIATNTHAIERVNGGWNVVEMILNRSRIPRVNGAFGGVGHVRYSTSGGYLNSVTQPAVVGGDFKIALAFNGTIANYRALAKEVGIKPENDTQAFANVLLKYSIEYGKDVVEALKALASRVVGGYSVIVVTNEPRIVLARDPRGFRPLAYGFNGGEFYAASETAVLDIVGVESWREVRAGEVVSFDGHSLEVMAAQAVGEATPCVFEYVYFSRPDSIFNGVSVYESRVLMGMELAKVAPAEADVVVPIPDSGRAAAIGYSRASGLPMDEGVVANKYIGRGFIMPPTVRDSLSSLKYGFVKKVVNGRRVVLVDDSIVRGTTMKSLVSKLRRFGAREIHVRVASPPFRYPCFMGIDVSSRNELLAWSKMRLEDIAKALGADSIAYNPVECLIRSVGSSAVCTACFTGRYPFKNLTVEDLESMFSR
ncbi:MAG: amidophosphoribosyltransferase [Zestosphaera tikiterensis]|uniref:Amidophosphoribosyltransferase n=1 Tax=Zestosphaera tikiterensis TaxID=1973259 RepID=A0A2R7Y928_9CREN|nr:MAG: amidophosphoribosyltransferase [Zestosphaera tikiterensis]